LSKIQLRCKIWLEKDGEVVLSDWRVELLEAIDRLGSLRAAAAELQVPYRTAWKKLQETESRLGERLVDAEPGGAEGGRSRLTAAGRAWVRRYRDTVEDIPAKLENRFAETSLEVT